MVNNIDCNGNAAYLFFLLYFFLFLFDILNIRRVATLGKSRPRHMSRTLTAMGMQDILIYFYFILNYLIFEYQMWCYSWEEQAAALEPYVRTHEDMGRAGRLCNRAYTLEEITRGRQNQKDRMSQRQGTRRFCARRNRIGYREEKGCSIDAGIKILVLGVCEMANHGECMVQ